MLSTDQFFNTLLIYTRLLVISKYKFFAFSYICSNRFSFSSWHSFKNALRFTFSLLYLRTEAIAVEIMAHDNIGSWQPWLTTINSWRQLWLTTHMAQPWILMRSIDFAETIYFLLTFQWWVLLARFCIMSVSLYVNAFLTNRQTALVRILLCSVCCVCCYAW